MTRGVPVPGVDVGECLDDIERHGFHLTDAHMRITDRYAGEPQLAGRIDRILVHLPASGRIFKIASAIGTRSLGQQ